MSPQASLNEVKNYYLPENGAGCSSTSLVDQIESESHLSNCRSHWSQPSSPEKGINNEVLVKHMDDGIHVEKNTSLKHSHIGIPNRIIAPPSLMFNDLETDGYDKDKVVMLKN